MASPTEPVRGGGAGRVSVNGKWLSQAVTGTQRYATEVASRLVARDPERYVLRLPADAPVPAWTPAGLLVVRSRWRGVAFEQVALPWAARHEPPAQPRRSGAGVRPASGRDDARRRRLPGARELQPGVPDVVPVPLPRGRAARGSRADRVAVQCRRAGASTGSAGVTVRRGPERSRPHGRYRPRATGAPRRRPAVPPLRRHARGAQEPRPAARGAGRRPAAAGRGGGGQRGAGLRGDSRRGRVAAALRRPSCSAGSATARSPGCTATPTRSSSPPGTRGSGSPSSRPSGSAVRWSARTPRPLPEVAGDGAAYFDPDDHESLRDALESVDVDRDGWAARGRVNAERFRWADTAAAVERVLDSIATPSRLGT